MNNPEMTQPEAGGFQPDPADELPAGRLWQLGERPNFLWLTNHD